MDRIAEMMRDTGLDFPTVIQLLAFEAGWRSSPEPAMPLPPDEPARLAWIAAWLAGVRAAVRAMGLDAADGPQLLESDASADYDRHKRGEG